MSEKNPAIHKLNRTIVDAVRKPILWYEHTLERRGIPPTHSSMVREALDSGGLAAGFSAGFQAIGERVGRQMVIIQDTTGEMSSRASKALQRALGILFTVSTPFEIAVRILGGRAGEKLLTKIYTNTPIVDWGGKRTLSMSELAEKIHDAVGFDAETRVIVVESDRYGRSVRVCQGNDMVIYDAGSGIPQGEDLDASDIADVIETVGYLAMQGRKTRNWLG